LRSEAAARFQARALHGPLGISEPDGLAPGERIFDISLQGEKVADHFDIAKAAGGRAAASFMSLRASRFGTRITIELKSSPGCKFPTVLCGVEVVAQNAGE